jgi:hypothetical protein
MRLEISMAGKMWIAAFSAVMPYCLVGEYQHFRGIYNFNLHLHACPINFLGTELSIATNKSQE